MICPSNPVFPNANTVFPHSKGEKKGGPVYIQLENQESAKKRKIFSTVLHRFQHDKEWK